jgi:glycosyltransferase involved in cell wall biosynthesis
MGRSPLRVAVVTPMSFGDGGEFGGGERYSVELARALSEIVDTRLVAVGRERATESMGSLRVETYPRVVLRRGWRTSAAGAGVLRSLVGVDVIHCMTFSTVLSDTCILLARLTGKRVFLTHHGGGGYITLARVANVAALSHGLLQVSRFADCMYRPGPPRRTVIYGGVDVGRFRPSGASKERRVLFVGRLLPHKGLDYLIEAVPAGVPLAIIGRPYDPAYLDRLRGLAEGKDVSFITDADDQRVVDEYSRASVSILPSVYDDVLGHHHHVPELLGLVLLEAMACGTAVICTDVGGMPEIVDDGVTGFIVPPNDPGALRERIMTILDTPGLAGSMGSAARERVLERFTWRAVAESCVTAYGLPPAAAAQ